MSRLFIWIRNGTVCEYIFACLMEITSIIIYESFWIYQIRGNRFATNYHIIRIWMQDFSFTGEWRHSINKSRSMLDDLSIYDWKRIQWEKYSLSLPHCFICIIQQHLYHRVASAQLIFNVMFLSKFCLDSNMCCAKTNVLYC